MRISDWSSDVCSSDLRQVDGRAGDESNGEGRVAELALLISKTSAERQRRRIVQFVIHLSKGSDRFSRFDALRKDPCKRHRRRRQGAKRGRVAAERQHARARMEIEIGRTSCRERWCQYV